MSSSIKEGVSDLFGSKVFNSSVMRKRLPKHIYASMLQTMREDLQLEENIAEVVANSMMDWALEQGATHFTHWFQPMTGITAEKHDSFISPTEEGKVIMEFSGKELIKGEPDASSFPSGGLRATFEARGYTAWDPTSYAFVKDTTLYIPSVFCSFSGQVLDKKTPLLRSMDVLSTHAIRVLKLFGKDDIKKVTTTIGAEQEYFLIEREMYKKRKDLILTGRTLFGAKPPKGQEMEDHYFGRIRGRVACYMAELDEELWKLGISSKSRHNEVAPCQHEMAPVFTNTNIACDNNQIIMELMRRVAHHHDLACLLHEKPFAGLNGSGKHNNFSMATDTGENLLSPGANPAENKQFLIFLCACIEAVYRYSEILRITVAYAGNDHRLGADEAPPAIVSVFLGDQLTAVLKSIETGKPFERAKDLVMDLGVKSLPNFIVDTTDRNRTSPFAFTGNRFEFRMLGSNQSIAGPNITLNTIVGDVLSRFADELERADNLEEGIDKLLKNSIKYSKKIVFNGNNYSKEWVSEAKRRGLPNLMTTPEALETYMLDKNVELFNKHHIFTKTEMQSRYEILLEEYSKTVNIEALTMLDIARQEIIPAGIKYSKEVCDSLFMKKSCGDNIDVSTEKALVAKTSCFLGQLSKAVDALDLALADSKHLENPQKKANYFRDTVIPATTSLRNAADSLETIVAEDYWPLPSYKNILFYV